MGYESLTVNIRLALNQHRRPVIACAVAIVLTVVVFSYRSLSVRGRPPLPDFPASSFYTDDDGATLFTDEIRKQPPFDHNGKPAVRAYVFSSDGGKHRWVQYLEKYGALMAKGGATDDPAVPPLRLFKKPGDQEWIGVSDPRVPDVITPRIPAGFDPGQIEPVSP